jgi:hypothetical protein
MNAPGPHLSIATIAARVALALAVWLGLAAGAVAQSETQVYLSKAEALDHVFPDASRVVELRHIFSRDEIARIEALTRKPLAEGGFYLYAALRDGEPTGYADA